VRRSFLADSPSHIHPMFDHLLHSAPSPPHSWFPTLTFSLDFKSRFPLSAVPANTSTSTNTTPSRTTVGLYSVCKFIHEGRHDQTVEVWSAPSGIGEKGGRKIGSDEWRREAQILGISTQVSWMLRGGVCRS
jgi:hypothetical protein